MQSKAAIIIITPKEMSIFISSSMPTIEKLRYASSRTMAKNVMMLPKIWSVLDNSMAAIVRILSALQQVLSAKQESNILISSF
jgi:hypothetical protein